MTKKTLKGNPLIANLIPLIMKSKIIIVKEPRVTNSTKNQKNKWAVISKYKNKTLSSFFEDPAKGKTTGLEYYLKYGNIELKL